MTPKAIQSAAAALAKAIDQRDRIASAVSNLTAADNAGPVANVETLQRDYDRLSAAAALGEVDPTEAKNAAGALAAAQEAVADAQRKAFEAAATRRGLDARLDDAEGVVTRAQSALEDAQRDWLRAELVAADRAYAEHAAGAWKSWTRVQAARALLASRGTPFDAMGAMTGEPHLQPAGPASAAAAQAAKGGPHGWGETLTPFHRPGADRDALAAELSEMLEPKPSLITRAARALAGNSNTAATATA